MYRKSTLFQTELAIYEENHAIAFSRHHGMTHSSLVLNDSPNSLYQYYEINMPYLILYESIHPQNNLSEYMEFTENSFLDANMPYSEYLKSASVKLHSHDFYELTFVMSGELTMHIEDDYITYHAGECCLCNKNIHHAEQMNPNTEIVLFLLKEDYVKDVFENLPSQLEIRGEKLFLKMCLKIIFIMIEMEFRTQSVLFFISFLMKIRKSLCIMQRFIQISA